jgi:hypothetical protein
MRALNLVDLWRTPHHARQNFTAQHISARPLELPLQRHNLLRTLAVIIIKP